jgi:hypothetical protein
LIIQDKIKNYISENSDAPAHAEQIVLGDAVLQEFNISSSPIFKAIKKLQTTERGTAAVSENLSTRLILLERRDDLFPPIKFTTGAFCQICDFI